MTTRFPPHPPPPESEPGYGPMMLAGLVGVIVALLIVLVIVLLARDPGAPLPVVTTAAASTTSEAVTTTVVPTTTAPTTTAAPTTTTEAISADLQPGDIVVAGEEGVRIVRDGEVLARPLDQPTQNAIASPDGSIVYHGVEAGAYPDLWPPSIPLGEPVLRIIDPDGLIRVLYDRGSQFHLFEIAEIPEVAAGPSAVLVRSDIVDDFPFRTDSIVIVPLDGSAPYVIDEVAGFESFITGLAWMDGFFAAAFAGEGIEAFIALDLDGRQLPWPANPEPADSRDFDVHVMNLTRIGDTRLIAYTRSQGFPFDDEVDLVIYDTAAGVEIASLPVFSAGFAGTAIHASADVIVVSGVEDNGAADWPLVQVQLVVVDAATLAVDEIDIVGTGSVVP
ncbi:MAG: hypothetical protein V3V29_04825 [Acidimicrobiia bacterium]